MTDIALPTEQSAATLMPSVPLSHPMATLLNPGLFGQLKTMAKMLSESHLVPKHFQNRPYDCFIALHMAHRLGADPVLVLQNLYIVHGTPGWSAKFIIAQANLSGVFKGRIKFRYSGEESPDVQKSTLSVTAYAEMNDGSGDVVEATASMEMARSEGWTSNAKYKGLQRQMLSYRAATLLVRLYAPEVLMGVQTTDEIEDTAASQPAVQVATAADLSRDILGAEPAVAAPEEAPEQTPEPEQEAAPAPAEELVLQQEEAPMSLPQVLMKIDAAKTEDDLAIALDLGRHLTGPGMQSSLTRAVRLRRKKLGLPIEDEATQG